MKNVIILVLLGVIWFMGHRIVHIQNQHAVMLLDLCPREPIMRTPDFKCLATTQTKTHWAYNLYDGMFGPW